MPPDLMAGRKGQIARIEAGLVGATESRAPHLLIVADLWMGKTSLALMAAGLARHLPQTTSHCGAAAETDIQPVFCSLGAATSLAQSCSIILNEAIRQLSAPRTNALMRILEQMRGFKLGPFGIAFEPTVKAGETLVCAFPSVLTRLIAKFLAAGQGKGKRGLLLILDQTENFARVRGAASLVKAMVEVLCREGLDSLMLLMTATPDDVERLNAQNASFASSFSTIKLGPLEADEVAELLSTTCRLGRPSKAFTEEAMECIATLSMGYPGFVQQLGSCAFHLCRGPLIDLKTVKKSLYGTKMVKGALAAVADKHFRHLIDLEPVYSKILGAIDGADDPMTSGEIRRRIPGIRNLGPYLRVLMQRSTIRKLGPPSNPRYKIAAPIVSLWLHLQRTLPARARP